MVIRYRSEASSI